MIVKDNSEADLLRRCLDSIRKHVDGLFITSTGEQCDEIKKITEEYQGVYSYFKWTKRFDEARNFNVSQIPKEYLYYIWCDADDVWQNPEELRQIVREAYLYNHSAVFFDYWYMVDLDEKGNIREIVIEHKRERIIKNDGTFKWIGKLHETLIEQHQDNVIKVFRPEIKVVHLTTMDRTDKNVDRNIEILEQTAKDENHKDPRTVMYLAKAYFDKGKMAKTPQEQKVYFEMAIALFQEYLVGSGTPGTPEYQEGSGWKEERSSAWEYVSEIYRVFSQYNMATKAIVNALIEDPRFPNYYISMAMICALKKEWDNADVWLKIGANLPVPSTTIILTPRDLKARALEVDFQIAMAKQDLDRAERSSVKIAEIFPDMKEAQERLKKIQELKAANQAAQSVTYLGRYLESHNEKQKISSLIQALPQSIANEQFASQMRHLYMPKRIWEKNEIAIICGPGFEKWSPKNVAQGIGGSEEAVIYLSKELVKQGYKVTVYADPQDETGEYDGVTYLPWYDLNIKDEFNILLVWRAIGFVDTNFTARKTYLWMHDIPMNPSFTKERLDKIDKVFVLSNFHKSLLKTYKDGKLADIPEDKVMVTSNGIMPVIVNKKWQRDPNKLVYTSSYDRGLVYLLNMWPAVKKEVPEAHLNIFYGWNLYDVVHANNPARERWKVQMQKLMEQDGIIDHGRVGHSELNKEVATAGIWAYPASFEEISCISAMRAQALGAVPVVANYAALKETVQHGVKVGVDITTDEGQAEYQKELIAMLKDPTRQEEIRKPMMEFAQKEFLWENVAKKWKEEFDK
jgi:glycosyltransferase involved in cell wall biosynthesis